MVSVIAEQFRLDGKVIVVTGASGLLGRKHVEAIASVGGNPVVLDVLEEPAKELAANVSNRYSVEAVSAVVDITDQQALEENVAWLLDKFGKIDGLVNNAANNPKMESVDQNNNKKNFSRLEHFPLELWEQDIAVGLTGAFLCAKHYGAAIAANSDGGVIVNISSDLGLVAPDQRLYRDVELPEDCQPVKPVTYSVVKTGLIGLTRYLATYWTNRGVRCNALCPGGVENGQPDDFLQAVSSRIPMNRLAKSDEYQGTLIWMLSSASSYLNGAVIPVEGGRTVW